MSRQRREPAPGGAEPSSTGAHARSSARHRQPPAPSSASPPAAAVKPATVKPATVKPAAITPTATSAVASSAVAETPTATDSKDVLYVHSPSESGDGYNVVRRRGDRVEVGQVCAPREGQPIYGELVRLTPREDSERLFDVEVVLAPPPMSSHKGPAQVATDRYRRNWDAVFGSRAAKGGGSEAPN